MRTGSGGLGVERVEVRDLMGLEEGGGDGEGRYFVVDGRQVRLDVRSGSEHSISDRLFRNTAIAVSVIRGNHSQFPSVTTKSCTFSIKVDTIVSHSFSIVRRVESMVRILLTIAKMDVAVRVSSEPEDIADPMSV